MAMTPVAQVVALQAAHVGGADAPDEVGILAVGLLDPSPAGVAGDVEHRRQRVAGADRHHLGPDDVGHLGDQRLVPGRGQADGLGELGRIAGAVAGHALLVDHHRDAQPGPLHRDPLDLVHQAGTGRRAQAGRRADAGHVADAVLELARHQIRVEAIARARAR